LLERIALKGAQDHLLGCGILRKQGSQLQKEIGTFESIGMKRCQVRGAIFNNQQNSMLCPVIGFSEFFEGTFFIWNFGIIRDLGIWFGKVLFVTLG
jgi:hypothetical protein